MTQSPSQVQVLLSYVAQMLTGSPMTFSATRVDLHTSVAVAAGLQSIGLDPVDDVVVCILKTPGESDTQELRFPTGDLSEVFADKADDATIKRLAKAINVQVWETLATRPPGRHVLLSDSSDHLRSPGHDDDLGQR